ncbi:MAG: S9 family peptidase [Alcanivoracaceae bacterium]|nr:S9 family peptidase [Alcanivoracaceae bacterium]
MVTQRGKWLYNFWQDKQHPRGIYRKTTLRQFKKANPKWQTVLDMDAYSNQREKNYDYHGMACLPPKGLDCLVFLSPSGGDAIEVREFDLEKHEFIEGGYSLPLAKSRISWIDKDTVYVGTDFGIGSMTDSGYPRIIKQWKRGTPLAEAKTLYTADKNSMSATAMRLKDGQSEIDIINETTSFWSSHKYQLQDNKITTLQLPANAIISGIYQGKLVVSLKKDWEFNHQKFIQGEILLIDIALLRGEKGSIESIIKPDDKSIIETVDTSKKGLLITILEDVKAKLYRYHKKKNGKWKIQNIPFPDNGALSVTSVDDETGDFFVQFESFITPPSLYHVKSTNLRPELIKQQAESFDGSKFKVEQYFSQSNDGTKIPYFVVMNKNTEFNGNNPTHIFSYGGFRNSLTPSYSGSYEALSGAYGKLWLERGGVFVLANIRGGGEYGPACHEAALLKNRHKAFEDFESVARDLFKRKITSAQHLGIEGRSNGGLLVTATMTRHPELYSAVVCGAPLIDMKRYNKLLAGASWMGEYGNPDEADMWEYIKTYSPYQNVKSDHKYPSIFFYTSTRDDRVHPGHARKMAAKLLDLGNDVDYYENIEGGHHGFSTNEQLAHRLALSYSHLWSHLK